MDIIKDKLDALDPEITGRMMSRRDALVNTGKAGVGLMLMSLPLSMGVLSTKAFGRGNAPQDVNEILNYALTLEYLERNFYRMGTGSSGLIPSSDAAIFAQIRKHEEQHVELLKTALGSNAIAEPTFNYTKNFPDLFTNYQTFLAVAQGFEDTGVRAYKGRAGELHAMDKSVLTTALRIHSVEARHAAEVRRLRGQKGWISGNDRGGLPAAAQPIYDGEQNTMQLTVTVTSTEAYDEPLTKAQVLTIVSLFQ